MRFDVVKTVFRKELREMLRDRRSLAVMFGIPLLLYPLITIGVASLGSSRQKDLTEKPGRVSVSHPDGAPGLLALLTEKDSGLAVFTPDDYAGKLAAGHLDAVIEVPPGVDAKAIAGEEVEIRTKLDRSRTSAPFVERKLGKAMEKYQKWVIEQRLARRGVPPAVLQPLKTDTLDIARSEQRFGKLLSQMLPLLLLMTGMLGALFPALNATTTERELGTLETLLVTPAGRTELLLAKGGLVLVCGLLTAGLNMLSMSLVLKRAMSMMDTGQGSLTVSASALALTYLAAVPALIFFTTVVLIVGLLARNFREANSFATPVMLLPLASLAVGIMEPAATPAILVTPIANTTVIIREVLIGRVQAGHFALAFASSCLYAGLMLSVAARLFSSEQLVNPAWEPLSMKGLRRGPAARKARRAPAVDEALALFAVSLLLMFYVTPSPKQMHLLGIVAVTQLLLILAPALLFAWAAGWDWRESFALRHARAPALAGAVLLGVGLAPWSNLLSGLQRTFWPNYSGTARYTAELIVDSLQNHPVLTIVLIGTLAGFCEELFFRGAVQTALKKKLPPWAALLFTALLFAAMHMDLHGLPLRTGLGVLLGWIVWRGGSVLPAMIAHGVYNSTQLTLSALQLRGVSRERAVEMASDASFRITSAEVVQLAVSAALLLAGWWLCRRVLGISQKWQEVDPRPAAPLGVTLPPSPLAGRGGGEKL